MLPNDCKSGSQNSEREHWSGYRFNLTMQYVRAWIIGHGGLSQILAIILDFLAILADLVMNTVQADLQCGCKSNLPGAPLRVPLVDRVILQSEFIQVRSSYPTYIFPCFTNSFIHLRPVLAAIY